MADARRAFSRAAGSSSMGLVVVVGWRAVACEGRPDAGVKDACLTVEPGPARWPYETAGGRRGQLLRSSSSARRDWADVDFLDLMAESPSFRPAAADSVRPRLGLSRRVALSGLALCGLACSLVSAASRSVMTLVRRAERSLGSRDREVPEARPCLCWVRDGLWEGISRLGREENRDRRES